MTGRREDGTTTVTARGSTARGNAARPSGLAESSANLARLVVPPAGAVGALGLAGAALATDSVALGVGGAVAGCVGAGAAWWQATTVEGRARRERLRNREGHRRLQLVIEDLRHRLAVRTAEAAQAAQVAEAARAQAADDVAPAEFAPAPGRMPAFLEIPGLPGAEPQAADEVRVPDAVPAVMPVARPVGAPDISMELPVLSTHDDAVAGGHLAAVVELRPAAAHRAPVQPLPIGELERKVYAAIAAQDAEKELATPAQAPAPAGAATAAGE